MHSLPTFPANLRQLGSRSIRVWRLAFIAAIACAALMAMQDFLYGGLEDGVAPQLAAAQYLLPWLTWAALAPAVVVLFEAFPIDLERPLPGVTVHAVCGIVVVGLKLIISAPAAALLIWGPLGVSWRDGVEFLLANRSGSNLLIFWALLTTYTAYQYYRSTPRLVPAPDSGKIERIPVEAGAGTAFVAVDNVALIESDRNQAVVFAGSDRYTTRATLRDLEQRLPAGRFLRIHRSRIINMDHVSRIEPWGRGDYVITLRGGARVLSGKTYRSAVRQMLDIG